MNIRIKVNAVNVFPVALLGHSFVFLIVAILFFHLSCKREIEWLVGEVKLEDKFIVQDQVFGKLPEMSCKDVIRCMDEGEELHLSCRGCGKPAWKIYGPLGEIVLNNKESSFNFMPDRGGTWLVKGKDGNHEVAFYFVVNGEDGRVPLSPISGSGPQIRDTSDGYDPGNTLRAPVTGIKVGESILDPPKHELVRDSSQSNQKERKGSLIQASSYHGYVGPTKTNGCITRWVEKSNLTLRSDKECVLYQGVVWTDSDGSLTLTLFRSDGASRSMSQQVSGGRLQLRLADLAPELDAGELVQLTIEAIGCRMADLTGCYLDHHSQGFLSVNDDPNGITLVDVVALSTQ